MKFSLLLFILSKVLKIASLTNNSYKEFTNKVSARILVKTKDGKHARLFLFEKGKFSSLSGDHKDFDVALVWIDSNTGFSAMMDKSGQRSINALADGTLRIEGMSVYAQWFENGIKLIMGEDILGDELK